MNATVSVHPTTDQFKSGVKGSYKCNSRQDVTMGKDVSLSLVNLQYLAFGESDTEDFPTSGKNDTSHLLSKIQLDLYQRRDYLT